MREPRNRTATWHGAWVNKLACEGRMATRFKDVLVTFLGFLKCCLWDEMRNDDFTCEHAQAPCSWLLTGFFFLTFLNL